MKLLLILCLAVTIAAVAASRGHNSSPSRSFTYYLKEKMRNVCLEIKDLKQEVKECCNQNDCTYDGQNYSHSSVFTATDGCNFCRCSNGSVVCTNSSSCVEIGRSSYNYKDQIAQAYCTAKSRGTALEYIGAVRRNCDPDGTAPPCRDHCQTGSLFVDEIYARFPRVYSEIGCIAGLWFMMDHPLLAPNPGPGQPDAGLLNMVTISYSSCSATDCSTNYCCCAVCWDGCS